MAILRTDAAAKRRTRRAYDQAIAAHAPRLRDAIPAPTRPILLGVALFVAVVLLALFGLTAEARYLGALLIALPAVGACWV